VPNVEIRQRGGRSEGDQPQNRHLMYFGRICRAVGDIGQPGLCIVPAESTVRTPFAAVSYPEGAVMRRVVVLLAFALAVGTTGASTAAPAVADPSPGTTNTYEGSGNVDTSAGPWSYQANFCEEEGCYYESFNVYGRNSVDYKVWCTNSCGSGDYYFLSWTKDHLAVWVPYGKDAESQPMLTDTDAHWEYVHFSDDATRRDVVTGEHTDSCAFSGDDAASCQWAAADDGTFYDPGVVGEALSYSRNGWSGIGGGDWLVAATNWY
jgi:hypothetical protein